MTPNQFGKLALALPDATEGAHGGHPDFRVGGKVFAGLGYPDATFGMVKLTPDQQAMLVEGTPTAFVPIANAWGLKGYTNVTLAPGQSRLVLFRLGSTDLAYYNAPGGRWTVAPGRYKVLVGTSSTELDQAASFRIGGFRR